MKLRSQLSVVSLVVLLLPWAGYSYLQQTEAGLREQQKSILKTVARSVALMLEGRGDLHKEIVHAPPGEGAGRDVYLNRLPASPAIDGYLDDAYESGLVSFTDNDEGLTAQMMLGADRSLAYLYVRVNDPNVIFRNPAETWRVWRNDHVQISLVDKAGVNRAFLISQEGPGRASVYINESGIPSLDRRFKGVWQPLPDGYAIELTFPRTLLGDRFGLVAVDYDGGRQHVGSMAPDAEPGRLIRPSRILELQFSQFSESGLRIGFVDATGWWRALNGQLLDAETTANVPGFWALSALYRASLAAGEDIPVFDVGGERKATGAEIEAALSGQESAAWYALGGTNDTAVISAAVPLSVDGEIAGAVVVQQSSAGILALTNEALLTLVGLSALLVVVVLGALLGYAIWLSQRIYRLGAEVTNVMAADARDLGSFPVQTAKDEIGALGRSFEQLLGRVHGYNQYLKTLASKLSHELRTPLAISRGAMENLRHEALSDKGRELVERAMAGNERLENVLNAMTSAARIEQSIEGAEKEAVDPAAWLTSCVNAYASVYPGQNIELVRCDEAPEILACPDLLSQMLDKLMDNAGDFCAPEGSVRLSLVEGQGAALIRVENDGPLLPENMTGQLFDSMVSVRQGKSEVVHMGLGLAIVRLIAEFHGGTVSAGNLDDGSGVSFEVRLPLNDTD